MAASVSRRRPPPPRRERPSSAGRRPPRRAVAGSELPRRCTSEMGHSDVFPAGERRGLTEDFEEATGACPRAGLCGVLPPTIKAPPDPSWHGLRWLVYPGLVAFLYILVFGGRRLSATE